MNQHGETMRQQAETIADLRAQLSKQQGPAGKGLKADKSRIKELEADNESLKVRPAMMPGTIPSRTFV